MTMKQIEQLAAVSSAAGSRYFNGGSLSQPKREAIRAAMEKAKGKVSATWQA